MAQEGEKAIPVPGRNEALPEGVSSAHILIVDDMPIMRKMIGMCLQRGGFSNLAYAEDGDEALDMIAETMPDLVVLDINMPKMSGYEVCDRLRAAPETANLPILVQSASETPEERVKVFASGATDFVSKPINHPELLARVCMHLENRYLIRSLTDFQERMHTELKMARDMQHSLLPEQEVIDGIQSVGDASIEAFYQASFELGGDLWGAWALPDNKIGLYVLDVTGHGVGAALNTFSLHATMARFEDKKHDAAAFLDALNQSLVGAFPLGQFATMFYGVLDCKTHELTYAGAGAPRPIIFGGGTIRTLDSAGLPIAIVKSATYENRTDRLEPGESLFCYSDVLVEAEQPDGSMLGEEGLIDWITQALADGNRQSAVSRLLDRFHAGQEESLPDDLTAVAIHRDRFDAEDQPAMRPLAVAVAAPGSEFAQFLDGLKSPDLDVRHVPDAAALAALTLNDNPGLAAYLIDGDGAAPSYEALAAAFDADFVALGGPVVLVVDGDPVASEPILELPSAKVFDRHQGQGALRRFVAEEVEDFLQFSALKRSLEESGPGDGGFVEGVFRFKSRADAQKLATMFSQAVADPMPLALGLSELFINAIEHGCLEIGHDDKGRLIDQGILSEEIARRQHAKEYRNRYATVEVRHTDDQMVFHLKDPGPGFDYASYLAADGGHEKKHGRGIVMAKGCFGELTYIGSGNEVRAVYRLPSAG